MVVATLTDDEAEALQLSIWLKQYCSLYQIYPSLMEFNSADRLLEAGKTHRLDVIFVSLRGPEGFLEARRIREAKPESSVIMIADTPEYAVRCVRLHFTDYIIRPIEFKNFVRSMKLAGVG